MRRQRCSDFELRASFELRISSFGFIGSTYFSSFVEGFQACHANRSMQENPMATQSMIGAARCFLPMLMAPFLFAPQFSSAAPSSPSPPAALCFDSSIPQARFAAGEIRRAFLDHGVGLVELEFAELALATNGTRVILVSGREAVQRLQESVEVAPFEASAPQSFALRRIVQGAQTNFIVLGADPAGMMYGGLELAEAVRLGTLDHVRSSEHAPHIERRGIKFNIPLDARTPSYSDSGDAAQQNIPEMWSFDFWREFLDELARHRFNVLTLWSLHPFPSIVKVPEFPGVALDDVKRTTLKLDDTFSHSATDMVRPAMLQNLETVKKISIGEKIQFWRDVMQYAHDRGIEVYFFTWNIYVWGAEGKYGITASQTNQATIDYFRASVRETVLTYPLLAGIGITSGEQMQNRKDEFSKEKWLWNTYGQGILDAKRLQPNRQIRLIHRFHQTALGEILSEWKDYPDTFDLSFKYSIAHMYSAANPPFIKSALPHFNPRLRTWLTVRNDDIYSFRWGDPAFARDFIRHMPGADKLAGYYMGPDGYVWGREFLSTEPDVPRELVLKKQWYSFMLWGRLSYDPSLPDELFERTLAHRFPQLPSGKLFAAWAEASKIFPQITRFFWGDIDLRWFPEACLSHPRYRGFFTVKHFIEGDTMPESGILNITRFREHAIEERPFDGITPVEVAQALKEHARKTLQLVSELRSELPASPPVDESAVQKELRLTLGDLESMAHVGNYYAEKILGATELALFDASGSAAQKASAVRHLESATAHWKRYAAAATKQYQPQLLNRVGYVDLNALLAKVEADVVMAANWEPGTIPRGAKKPSVGDIPFRR
jgi:hypothetical protein